MAEPILSVPARRTKVTPGEASRHARDYWRRAQLCFAQYRLHRAFGKRESALARLHYSRQYRRFAVYWSVLARELRT